MGAGCPGAQWRREGGACSIGAIETGVSSSDSPSFLAVYHKMETVMMPARVDVAKYDDEGKYR